VSTPIQLSVVSPVYRAELILPDLVREIHLAVQPLNISWEIVLVDDSSPDNSWKVIVELIKKYPTLRGARFSRNFGQQAAITAGLELARGQYAVVMDCDLQHHPRYIPELLRACRDGVDIVYTHVRKRKHGLLKNFFAALFHKVFRRLTDTPSVDSQYEVGSYSLLSRKAIDAFLRFTDRHRHYLLILRWMGFKTATIEIDHYDRHSGVTTYSFFQSVTLAIDGIASHSNKLLWWSIGLGAAFCCLAGLGVIHILYRYFTIGLLPGWTSLIVAILVSTGVILIMLGIVGIYIGKIFDQSRARPLYLFAELAQSENSL